MTVTGDNVLISLIILAVMLTAVSIKADMMLFRIGAMMSWLGLGYMFMTGTFGVTWASSWVQLIGLACVVMAFACLVLQFKTEGQKKQTPLSPSIKYRQELQERIGRNRKRRVRL